jgi:hypothetical protein
MLLQRRIHSQGIHIYVSTYARVSRAARVRSTTARRPTYRVHDSGMALENALHHCSAFRVIHRRPRPRRSIVTTIARRTTTLRRCGILSLRWWGRGCKGLLLGGCGGGCGGDLVILQGLSQVLDPLKHYAFTRLVYIQQFPDDLVCLSLIIISCPRSERESEDRVAGCHMNTITC